MFLPKFHCELNPIEMVCSCSANGQHIVIIKSYSIEDGAKQDIGRFIRSNLRM